MDDFDAFVSRLSQNHPGYANFIARLCTLASAYLPPFIYITDANNPRVTASVVDAIFREIPQGSDFPPTCYARVNAVTCFHARVFYDTVLNALAGWEPTWESGCQTWPGEDGVKYNDSIDSFLHGLRRLSAEHGTDPPSRGKGKGKAKAETSSTEELSLVIFIERAERLCENLPELIVPLSRLAELARVRVNVILLSSMHWVDLRPPLGAAPDPYFLDVEPLTKPDIIQRLVSAFRNTSQNFPSSGEQSMSYHPGLLSLYEHYAEMIYGTTSLYTGDPIELQYIAAARWPGFVKPVVWQQSGDNLDADGVHEPDVQLPNTDGRLRLFKYFSSSFTHALEALYPRLTNAADWAAENDYDPTEGLPEIPLGSKRENARKSAAGIAHLPRLSKFILIAAFLASTNPAKSDMRMFGRGTSERKKKRRRNMSSTKGGSNKNSAVSQRLLGPSTFPLDRLLAILGALLEEHDVDSWPFDHRFVLPGEYTDMEIGRIHVYAAVSELAFMRALHRMSPMEKMDGPPTFKCGISYEVALALAKDVGISSLNDLMWDPALAQCPTHTLPATLLMPDESEYRNVQAYPLQRFDAEHKNSLDLPTDEEKEFRRRRHSLSADSHFTSPYSSDFDDPNLDIHGADELDHDSPYPEVRAAVANTDDPSIPAMTLRTWVLGLAWAVITSGLNQFMFYRYPSVAISSFVPQLLSFPMGKLWARYIPRKRIFGVSLNPGPFSMKEHVLITVFFGCTDQWFLVLSTQLIGFSAGGIARRFLVSPPSMIWPSSLVTCALFNTLHSQQYAGAGQLGGLSRERFFLYAFLCAFVWFQALSYFSWVTWIWPDNAEIAQLFGYIGSPLATPWWAAANVLMGFVIFYFLAEQAGRIQSRQPYNVTRVLTDDVVFDEVAYNAYSPLFMTYALLYLFERFSVLKRLKDLFCRVLWIMMQARRSLREQPDIHARLMSVYRQVPDWWYLVLFVIMFALGVVSFEVWPTYLPVWAFVVALLIGRELIRDLRYALPGRPIAMMMFKTWGYITMTQALTFAADFKLGHYMKIPPRKMFWCQIVAAMVAATTQLGVQTWMFNNIPDMCSQDQKDGFTCPYTEVFGTASIIWGVVGPALQFSSGQRYHSLRYVNPVFFNGTSLIPPATALNFVPWALVNYIFQNIIRKHNFPWWAKYNYVLSAALDSGLAVSVLVIFFALQYPMNGMVFKNNDDGQGVPVLQLATGQTFG
ncbi:origin recognition complex subunit 5 C-terminus-domain-containing protein [Pisolithus thermaeus]|nr:origin recognition complex subunit 5 C-terminus-domain-containing protein [Pisolithus croceorrhizus]KAI6152857.1 origin recognition complex subunit 5 C-terminus-domain-containing protein [Pisolithus thermaeus]